MNRAKTIQEILQEQQEERDRQRLADFLLKLLFAHIIIVTVYFYFSK
jgi:predicted nucleic acid-binding Zn ribbon protein